MKKKNFLNEVTTLSEEELKSRAAGIAEELMKLRFRQASGQYEQSHRFQELKKNLARVQTILAQKKQSKAAAPSA